ncbi:unnamed protein product [Lupinus luteus]|uniref:F-box associated beta-propeller type 1 domain-containing protein n=1 Tax=Lupinus luteus TaxID=3873 RepID=A0AAV1W1R0_LUPLU
MHLRYLFSLVTFLPLHGELHSKISPPHVPVTYGHNELNIPKFGIVNSCNGLLCVCTSPFNNPIYVCNPITGEYIMLPKPKLNPNLFCYYMDEEEKSELYKSNFVVSGFGFNPKTNQYKVMRMMELETTTETRYVTVQVLTLGSTSWETIGSIQSWDSIGVRLAQITGPIIKDASYKKSFCVYLNGSVHWLCNSTYNTMFIASFNFENENIVEILPPSQLRYEGKQGVGNMRLGVLNDCLYLTDVDSYVNFKIWVLKDYNDRKMSWTLDWVIDTVSLNIWPRGLYQPIKYLENGDLLMFHPSNALVCYSPKQKRFRYFKIHGIDSDFEMVPHSPCLLPMKDVVRVENPQVQILNTRDMEEQPNGWKEYHDVALVEEDERTIHVAYSKIVLENKSFNNAFTSHEKFINGRGGFIIYSLWPVTILTQFELLRLVSIG